MPKLKYKNEVYAIIGAAMEVHTILGHGFLEAVYHEAFEIELGLRNIPFQHEPEIRVYYKNNKLQKKYEPDVLCYNHIIIELKTMDALTSKEEAQILNYLKASGGEVALLINFGSIGKLEWKRFVM